MRTKILFLTILIGFISINKINAQQCGTPMSGSNQEFSSTNSKKSLYNESICINVFFHIVRQSNGTGGFNSSNIDLIVEDLNEYYNPFDIYINKQGVDFIDNSTYYDLTSNEFNSLIGINNSSNSINFYLVNSAPYAGRAEAILSKNLVVYNSYALSPTSAHELGHCLNLWHTHHGLGCNDLGGCAEAIDGSNSATCGDFVTDTPADPCVLGQVNDNCQYTGGGGYNPDPTNIMSYGGSCRNHFTSGQAQRMRNTISGSSLLQQIVSNSCAIAEISPIDYLCYPTSKTLTISNLEDNTTTWQVSSNVRALSSNNSSITVRARFSSSSGSGWVRATLSNGIVLQENFGVNSEEGETMLSVSTSKYRNYLDISIQNGSGITPYTIFFHGINRRIVTNSRNSSIYYPHQGGSITVTNTNICGGTDTASHTFYHGGYSYSSFFAYPNPATTELNIENKTQEHNIKFKLFNFKSELVLTGNIEDFTSIDVSSLQRGLYFLKIYKGNKVVNASHIVLK